MNPFGSGAMALGYAESRPPLHELIIERARQHLSGTEGRALDVGCGSGLSTRALRGQWRVGLEPAVAMLRHAPKVAPDSAFVAGTAEQLPFADRAFTLLTAAGSLNYVGRLEAFLAEAARVSSSNGQMLVYDFRPGRSFANGNDRLDRWFEKFLERYPPPVSGARPLSPALLRAWLAPHWKSAASEEFTIPLKLTPGFYLRYMMTESGVAEALRLGVPAGDIRQWCAETLAPVWHGEAREVAFAGYWVVLRQPNAT